MTIPKDYAELVLQLLRNIASSMAPRRPIQIVHANSGWQNELKVIGTSVRFRGCAAANKNATDGFWLFVCDGEATVPTCAPLWVPAGTTQSITWEDSPRIFRNGIYLCASTDATTKTLPATSDAYFECAYDLEL
jgi:hypothetical protein